MALSIPPIFTTPELIQAYPNYGEIPKKPSSISAISIGPKELNDSDGELINKYWSVQQIDGKVVIRKSLL
ncbi:MAG: hypothetical protein CMC55_06790 [Flavobacteriaceae bacterium]|nr:hypothetical protein [Flavobacteriaceae bacterium]|tara:strand:- start:86 stop:295 length:210 start_codon:yes stop_codon:yes gene_type:complete